jgi:hypothetical protein
MRSQLGSLITIGCLGLFGCAGTTASLDQERRLTAVENPDVPLEVRNAILGGRVMIGMSDGMVAASWGLPRQVDVDKAPGSRRETWVYGSRLTPGWETTLVFDNGTVVDMQQKRVQGIVSVWDPPADSYRSADPHSVARSERAMNP